MFLDDRSLTADLGDQPALIVLEVELTAPPACLIALPAAPSRRVQNPP
jgi:hypothetical protein